MLCLTLCHILCQSLCLILSQSLCLTLSQSLCLTLSQSLCLTLCQNLCLILSQSLCLILSQNLCPNRRTEIANPASRATAQAQPPATATHLRLTFAPVRICSLRMSARTFQVPMQREDESRVPAER